MLNVVNDGSQMKQLLGIAVKNYATGLALSPARLITPCNLTLLLCYITFSPRSGYTYYMNFLNNFIIVDEKMSNLGN
jgi:hypothetical protein